MNQKRKGRVAEAIRPFRVWGVGEVVVVQLLPRADSVLCRNRPKCLLSGCLRPRKVNTGGRRGVSLAMAMLSRTSRRAYFIPAIRASRASSLRPPGQLDSAKFKIKWALL